MPFPEFNQFAMNLSDLNLPKQVRITIRADQLDDTEKSHCCFMRTIVKVLPKVDKFEATQCCLHSHFFQDLSKGLKVLIIKDSHVKLYPSKPEHLQTIILKNCVLLSKANWATNDFASLKRFAMQDSVVNFLGLLYKPFSHALQEYTLLDSEPRTTIFFDPLDCFSRYPMAKRFTHVRKVRVRGKILTVTVIDFLRHLIKG
mmetsp:Transcript_43581/g.57725  ORF Transcript_43581/g.57725 Transcript_43581/m.57725 type:complete len:201 (-) Transcript_43581:371-973(-)